MKALKKRLAVLLCLSMLTFFCPAAFADGTDPAETDSVSAIIEAPQEPESADAPDAPESPVGDSASADPDDPGDSDDPVVQSEAEAEPEAPALPAGEADPDALGDPADEEEDTLPATTRGPGYGSGDWSNGWGWWSQGQSAYGNMRANGCLVVAQAKLLVLAGIVGENAAAFNPDIYYNWLVGHGYIASGGIAMSDKSGPRTYAAEAGKGLGFEGSLWSDTETKVWENIFAGKYSIVRVHDGTDHFILVNNVATREAGKIRIYQSWDSSTIPGTRDLTFPIQEVLTYSLPAAPAVSVSVSGTEADVSWSDVGAQRYYLSVKNRDTGKAVFQDYVGGFRSHLALAQGGYVASVAAVFSTAVEKVTSKTFEIGESQPDYAAPTVSVSVSGSEADVSWNDVGAQRYYLSVKNRETGTVAFQDYVGGFHGHLALSPGKYVASVAAVYSTSVEKVTSQNFEIVEKTFTLCYDANGGVGAPEPQQKKAGQTLILSETEPTREGGYSGGCTVSLDPNGGSVNETGLVSPRYCSYRFQSWNTAADGSGGSYYPGGEYRADANATLYAQWSVSEAYETVTLPTAARWGFTFLGWALSSSASAGVTGSYTPTGPVTLYAIWEERQTYTVSYDANGGDGPVPDAQTKYHGYALFIPQDVPTRSDEQEEVLLTLEPNGGRVSPTTMSAAVTVSYRFVTWTMNADGTGLSLDPGMTYTRNAPAIFYARWDSSRNGEELTLPLPERAWYTFRGWAEEMSAEEPDYLPGESVTLTENTTLYALWSPDADLNGDGAVDASDLDLLASILKTRGAAAELPAGAGDLDGSGVVNGADLVRLAQMLKAAG